MNAPFAWPTNHPLPKYRITRVAIASLGVLLASCSDGLTTPGERPPTSAAGPSLAAPFLAAPDVVIMERTTTDAFREGDTPVVHSSRVVLTSQMRIAGRTAGVRALPSSSDPTPQRLPRPPLSLPARREVAICSFLPTWTEHAKTGNGRDLLLTGIGDAPASTIRIPQDDGSMLTVERSWTRTATNWQLDRQITKGAHGGDVSSREPDKKAAQQRHSSSWLRHVSIAWWSAHAGHLTQLLRAVFHRSLLEAGTRFGCAGG
jgi:hypothetical protein